MVKSLLLLTGRKTTMTKMITIIIEAMLRMIIMNDKLFPNGFPHESSYNIDNGYCTVISRNQILEEKNYAECIYQDISRR